MPRTFRVLGPLGVVVDGIDITPRAPKERSLLALLLMRGGEVVSADQLIEELWPNLPVERARRVLWVRLAALRAALRRVGADDALASVPAGYRLAVDPADVDAEQFRALVRRADAHRARGDHLATADALRGAVDLWRGPSLADAQGSVTLEAAAARLDEARLAVTEDWIDAELACGRHALIADEVRRLVAEHPLRERLVRQLAACLTRRGARAEAVRAFRTYRQRLRDELGVEPSPAFVQLEHEQQACPATPPARGATPHNLPLALTRFVGRSAELADISALLSAHRLVTLTGVGGVGKTRLALEAAAGALDRHGDGVWLVELAPLPDGAAVVTAVASVVGLVVDGHDDGGDVERLVEHLGDRRALLVLDNAEHVVDAVTTLAHRVLVRCPGVTLLVTSRVPLHVAGEVVSSVPPLALPAVEDVLADGDGDALVLFEERSREAGAGRAGSDADRRAAVEICRRLDGLPLAIELAAARRRVLGAGDIAARLADCFGILAGPPATGVPDRHRTMRATIDWSHDLLTAPEQVALRRLAVFPGDFDVDAAAAVIACEPESRRSGDAGFGLLAALVDRSLVEVVQGGARFRLLEPIRQYAAERLAASGEGNRVRDVHRDVYVARTGPAWPLMTAQQRRRKYADRDNLRAALDWSWQEGDSTAALQLVATQAMAWMCPGSALERAWLQRVLDEPEPALHPARVQALVSLAINLHDAGDACRAQVDAMTDEAIALAERIADPIGLAACRLASVEQVLARRDVDWARALTADAMRAYEHLGEPAGIGWCEHHLGWIAIADGDRELARSHFERSVELARGDPGGEWLLPHALAALAPVLASAGEPQRAIAIASEAVELARPFDARAVLAMALSRAVEVSVLAGDDATAATTLVELLRLLRDLGTRRWIADALGMAAVVLERRDEPDLAVALLAASTALRTAAGGAPSGVDPAAAAVEQSERSLARRLAADQYQADWARGLAAPPEVVAARVLAALTGGTSP